MNAGAYSPPFNSIGVKDQTTIRLATKPASNPKRRNDRHTNHARTMLADAKMNHATTYDIISNPFDDLPGKIVRVNVLLGHDISVYADTRTTNFVPIPGNERVPVVEWTTLIYQSIRTRGGQPGEITNRIRVEVYAILNQVVAVRVTTATATLHFKQVANHRRRTNGSGVRILEANQTTLTASVTQRFPFRSIQLPKFFGFPERLIVLHVHAPRGLAEAAGNSRDPQLPRELSWHRLAPTTGLPQA